MRTARDALRGRRSAHRGARRSRPKPYFVARYHTSLPSPLPASKSYVELRRASGLYGLPFVMDCHCYCHGTITLRGSLDAALRLATEPPELPSNSQLGQIRAQLSRSAEQRILGRLLGRIQHLSDGAQLEPLVMLQLEHRTLPRSQGGQSALNALTHH